MSMTREEAANILDRRTTIPGDGYTYEQINGAIDLALAALRTPTREQVKKVWAGCEYCEKHKINLVRIEMNYNDSPGNPERLNPTRVPKFCPICGCPLTDEVLEMVMERMEALKDGY